MNSITSTKIDRIRTLAAELDTLGRTALEKASEAGHLLIECKAQLKHGEWLPWLESNFSFTDRTARRWIKLAEDLDSGKLKLDTESDLSLSEAYKLTADSRPGGTDDRPETFSELSESGKDRCRIWWDCCAAEVLARWSMDVPAESIAEHCGRSLDEVERIIRPRFIPWESYQENGMIVPVELYDSARRNLVAFWMDDAARRAAYYLNDLSDSEAKESAKGKLLAKAGYYKEEYLATKDCTGYHFMSEGIEMARNNSEQVHSGHFLYNIGDTAMMDARHACGIRPYPGLDDCLKLMLPWHVLWPTNHGLNTEDFTLLITDTEAFREHMKAKEKGEAAA